MIKAIIFDFDGVIADSNNVKTEAFVQLFDRYPSYVKDAVKRFHLENGGMSRFDKFRYIYANIINEPLPEETFNGLCRHFERLVVDGVINASLIDGIKEFLEKSKNRYKLYIVSGTPEEEIEQIVRRRRLDKYFSGIYGSPRAKKDIINYILKENSYNREEVVFLGDSINDYEGAMGTGVEFIAKISDNLGFEQFPNVYIKAKIRTIDEFERYLNGKNKSAP